MLHKNARYVTGSPPAAEPNSTAAILHRIAERALERNAARIEEDNPLVLAPVRAS
jgi:hypothetical protein